MNTFYQLKITLEGTEPAIWRRFVVPANITLDRLHDVVQIVMGWQDCHLHHFMFKKQIFTEAPESNQDEDESTIRLNELLKRRGNKLTYLYDFGDDWEHQIVLEDKDYSSGEMLPEIACLEGMMACPPEDCGGASSYMCILRAVFDPQNNEEDYEDFLEHLGLDDISVSDVQSFVFHCDLNAVNMLLAMYSRWSRDRALPMIE
ncbi:plasmid pRiA4b ORF-3 family protein [Phytobacter sp. V91]|uniref:plasmid pRiA4b ORF-3 family protein n=1 Tax=Phytobacter sp. V91 TaxID=3369425 RepID=UPI003F629FD9